MKPLKKVISENIVNPIHHHHARHVLPGRVVRTFDDDNTCTVNYTDLQGYENQQRVSVRVADPNGWFPGVNDSVILEETAGTMFVTGPHTEQYNTDWQPRNRLQHDIYDDGQTDTSPGCVY